MGFQSKTYSLSDEVVAAIEAARARGLTPNKYLRYLIGLDGKDGETIRIAVAAKNEVNATVRQLTKAEKPYRAVVKDKAT